MSAKGHLDGMVAPRIYLTDNSGKTIFDQQGRDVSKDIVRFEYSYDEEDDDRCSIVFQFSDVYYPDIQKLQRDKLLIVSWGFINQDGELILSPQRLIAIRDRKTSYEADKMTLELECTDNLSYLKKRKIDGTRKTDYITWLSEIAQGTFKPTFIINDVEYVTYNNVEAASYDRYTNGVADVAVENTAAPIFAEFQTTRIIRGNSKAIPQAIQHELMFAQGGPWFVDGRDNTLTIHNRDFKQKEKNTYYYNSERGDIIKFRPFTQIEKNEVKQQRIASIDLESQTMFGMVKDVIRISDLTKRYNDDVLVANQEIDRETIQQYIDENLTEDIFKSYVLTGGVIQINSKEELEAWTDEQGNLEAIPKLKLTPRNIINHDTSNSPETIPNTLLFNTLVDETRFVDQYIEDLPEVEISASDIINSPYTKAEIQNLLDNDMREREHKKYQADITIIGDPSLTSSTMIRVSGVAKRHAGSYYVVKCTHKLSVDSGYTTTMETIRKPSEVAIKTETYNQKLNNGTGYYFTTESLFSEDSYEILTQFFHSKGKDVLTAGVTDQDLYDEAVRLGIDEEDRRLLESDLLNTGTPEEDYNLIYGSSGSYNDQFLDTNDLLKNQSDVEKEKIIKEQRGTATDKDIKKGTQLDLKRVR